MKDIVYGFLPTLAPGRIQLHFQQGVREPARFEHPPPAPSKLPTAGPPGFRSTRATRPVQQRWPHRVRRRHVNN